jgi:uncharacterized protein YkwD
MKELISTKGICLALVASVALTFTTVLPAEAKTRPVVTIAASATSVASGTPVTISGTVSGKSKRAGAILQKAEGADWFDLQENEVTRSKTYAFSVAITPGDNQFRVKILKTKKSKGGFSGTVNVGGVGELPGAPSSAELARVRGLILLQTNTFRLLNLKPPVQVNSTLNNVAETWSIYMARNDVFYHNPSYFSQSPNCGSGGENIAAGQTPETVVNSWINSPPHKENLLGDWTHIGIGYGYNANSHYKRYYTQDFCKM